MQFRALASSSSGNAYLLTDQGESILIECGIPWKRVQQAMNFETRGIRFCLVSHAHLDHSKYIKDVVRAGIDVWAPLELYEKADKSHRFHIFELVNIRTYSMWGDWSVVPFKVTHDVPCLGFLIAKGQEKCLYLTDALYSPFRFKDLTMICLAVNYAKETISADIDPAHRRHIIRDHMSLQTAKDLLAANDLSKVREIHLLHLSAENSDAELFKSEIQKLTGKPTYVCAA